MAAAIARPTLSMQAGAEQLLADPTRWTSARRKADGRRFWIIQGRTNVYYADAMNCTCPSARHRGLCRHMLAGTMREADQAARLNPSELPVISMIGGGR